MEQTQYSNLPVIGRVQHGEQIPMPNGGKRAKELGHFIAKIQDDYMRVFLQKFDEQYKGKQYLEIEFCSDNPLTKKFVRCNQSGQACYCIEGNTTGSQKTKNGWQPINCDTYNCEYRQKNEQGKLACNRIGWLKFFIPSISKDRIWLMKITGQTSINRIDAYINLQKLQGKSLNDIYILFLKQEEQTNKATGQTFNNYVLDIIRKEDFIQTQQIPKINEKPKEVMTINDENSKVVKQEQVKQTTVTNTEIEDKKQKKKTQKKSDIPKETKGKTKKSEQVQKDKQTKTQTEQSNECDNYYILDSTFKETITNKKGEKKEYLVGKFYDINDQICNIVINPSNETELLQCDLGTIVELDIKEIAERKFAINLKFINKQIKKVAA